MLNVMLIHVHQPCMNIPKVDDMFKIQICKLMYLFINCMLPESLMKISTPNFYVMVSKTFIYQGPNLWQDLLWLVFNLFTN